MELAEIETMNKKELAAELKKNKLPCSGNKRELKNRLRKHVEETAVTVNDVNSDDEEVTENDASASEDEANDTLQRLNQLEKEMQERLTLMDGLRRKVHSSTRNTVAAHSTNTKTKPAKTGVQRVLRSAASVRLTEPVPDDVRVESEELASNGAVATPVVRVRELMSSVFSFRDIEESLNTFSGDDAYTVNKWIADTERSAQMFKWSDLQQLMYAKRLLKGTAKKFVRTIDADSWDELKEELRDQFDVRLSDAEVHKKLGERKKTSKETLAQYLIAMNEIGRANYVEGESIMHYVIEGIDDEPHNKGMLYGATTMKEFRAKLLSYEKFRSSFGRQRESKHESKREARTSLPNKPNDKCYSCGEDGHIRANCPRKDEGTKCFAYNEFGHRSAECPGKGKKESNAMMSLISNGDACGDMYKAVKINECVLPALIDTGCDLNLVRDDAVKCVGLRYEKNSSTLRGLGGKETTTLGSFTAEVKIDDVEFQTKFHVVEARAMPMLAIIGKELMSGAEVVIKRNVVGFKMAVLNVEQPMSAIDNEEREFPEAAKTAKYDGKTHDSSDWVNGRLSNGVPGNRYQRMVHGRGRNRAYESATRAIGENQKGPRDAAMGQMTEGRNEKKRMSVKERKSASGFDVGELVVRGRTQADGGIGSEDKFWMVGTPNVGKVRMRKWSSEADEKEDGRMWR